ncbi:uncharacterized protein LOC116161684 [Photinus pyralis]|nr:uncharacterized protein LOC116161684 [Photinus pyralis]
MPNQEELAGGSVESLKLFKNKRKNLKSSLTRFQNYVAGLEESFDIFELKARVHRSENLLSEFESIQDRIETLEHSDELDDSDQIMEFENNFFKVMSRARKLIETCHSAHASSNGTNSNSVQGHQSSFNPHNSIIKLPTMHLPEFDGSYDKWMGFYDTLDALVNKNESLTNVQRFYYLKSALKGEAAHLLNSLEVTDANYNIAWNLLKERYENRKLIISTHIKSIFELPLVLKDSHKSLRSLIDNFNKHLRSLKNLELPTDKWDILLIYILVNKLDTTSKHEWEKSSVNNSDLPSLADLLKFLVDRCQILENMSGDDLSKQLLHKRSTMNHLTINNSTITKCPYCKGDHMLFRCSEFLKLSVPNRWNEVKKLKLCTNCFRSNHFNNECRGSYCRKCNRNHNTVLHNNSNDRSQADGTSSTAPKENPTLRRDTQEFRTQSQTHLVANTTETIITTHSFCPEKYVILSTATINIKGEMGKLVSCRALLDSGSQSNFITAELVQKLGLTGSKINMKVSGVDRSTTNINKRVTTEISSLFNNFRHELGFLVLRDITGNVPINNIAIDNLKLPHDINLADHEFHISRKVDVLLGSGIFWNLLRIGQIKLSNHNAMLQKTVLGWVFAGSINCNTNDEVQALHSSNVDVQDQLEKFWSIEECEAQRDFTNEEIYCESHFTSTFKRDPNGRFVVRLPMRDNHFNFENSLGNATRRFYSLENRFSRDLEFKKAYHEFIDEYERLGHMSEVRPEDDTLQTIFYLPHHGVIKNSSTTTKLRVVFDGSCKSTSGQSLNDKLCVGPHIQSDLFSIIIRFRKHNIIYTADIAKMYRQINVADDQRDLQRIVWRNCDSEPLRHYRLNTITYGTGPASFLAMRCLQQLGNENMEQLPDASDAIINDFYMDDLITGTSTVEEAIKIKGEITSILAGAGFQLRKWASNHKAILNQSDSKREVDKYYISEKDAKTLGLMWDTDVDTIGFSLSYSAKEGKITKRSILSIVAKIFDPLGLLGPLTIRIKIILQRLWKNKLSWDEAVPWDIYIEWKRILNNLGNVGDIKLPRQVTIKNYDELELHGFCDSSEEAYGCCVYIRSIDKNGNIKCNLLCAKSRVAPLKPITIPRLELCGAVLLANLMRKVINSFKAKFSKICYWCDSTIVLSWINSEPANFQIFVANRVNEIQKYSDASHWYHVKTTENPADLISRGLSPEMLRINSFWWEGPMWLKETTYILQTVKKMNELPETRNTNHKTLSLITITEELEILKKYSNIIKLQRVLAYSLRFVKNLSTHKNDKLKGELSVDEIKCAMRKLILVVQAQSFKREVELIKNGKRLSGASQILSLNPFVDKDGILRVGGRLSKSSFNMRHKHPIILPSNSTLTDLIIDHEHKRNLHIGVEGTLSIIRTQFWPIHGRSTVKKVIHKCIKCARFRRKNIIPLMGNLPRERLQPSRPFLHTAVDYAGPFLIKDGKTRNRKIIKAYLCLFVCFATKAVHLELAGDLTTLSFLNAFKRFVGRRGICSSLYSDNGTNFVGANRELKDIDWKFIPSRSPHFGGFYEAAIKSAKSILKKVVGNAHLTFEQLSTVFVQIESVLNSRPITPISNDPNDLLALTPGHFLIGDIPQENDFYTPERRLTHYTRLNQMFQHFWNRWSKEYTHTLQARSKWNYQREPIQTGTMVLLKGESTPTLLWPLGRVVELHPGSDGTTRVVTVRTGSGLVKRAVAKLCVLPIDV